MGGAISRLFDQLWGKQEMRILMVSAAAAYTDALHGDGGAG